jgi:TRAP-type uncharacterized transport system substrate-binding protein
MKYIRYTATCLTATVLLFNFLTTSVSKAQNISICEQDKARCTHELNNHRIGLISGGSHGTYIVIADDLRLILDGYNGQILRPGEGLRITPMIGRGSVQNIEDLLYLTNTDIGLVQADVLEFFRLANATSGKYKNIIDNIKYLTQIYSEEVHIVCRTGACGKYFGATKDILINVGPKGSGTALTATVISETIGFQRDRFKYMDYGMALEELRKPKTSPNQIDAMFYVGGKPIDLLTKITEKDGLELVELEDLPPQLDVYVPGEISENDGYAALMGSRKTVRTVAVPAILAVWGADYQATTRSHNLRAFCFGLVQELKQFKEKAEKGTIHRKWLEWDPRKAVKGWVRHEFMEEALRNARSN